MISLGLSITSLAARSRRGIASLNLVANGNFGAGTTDWRPAGSTSLAIEAGRLRVIAGESAIRVSQVVNALVEGRQYRLTADIDASASTAAVTAHVNSVVSPTGSLTVLKAAAGQSGTYEATFTARAGDDVLLFHNFLGRGDYWLDNIEIKPI